MKKFAKKHPILAVLIISFVFEGLPLLGPIALEKYQARRRDAALQTAAYYNRGSNFSYMLHK